MRLELKYGSTILAWFDLPVVPNAQLPALAEMLRILEDKVEHLGLNQ
jgi:hypothetical protein